MPWSQTSPMDQKTQFIADYLRQSQSISALCALYGISRKTGYKWIERYHEQGPAGLEARSCQPQSSPNQTATHIVQALIELRHRHPSWGAKKLLTILGARHPHWNLPARSTACEILARHGLVPKKRTRARIGHPGKPVSLILNANDCWSADFKGQFKTGDGFYCYPLTITDNHSRYLLACRGLSCTAFTDAKPVFTRVFRQFGLPQRIRTDNGAPFATHTLGRLSRLSVWWIRLGVLPELIAPGKPQQNGRHERMHRTLKAETTRPAAHSLRAQQRKFDHFIQEFNFERPHEALDMKTPASCHSTSLRQMPSRLPSLQYPDCFEVRRVSPNGGIRWRSQWVSVSHVCEGEDLGLEEIDDGVWNVYLGPLKLGRLLEQHMRIEDAYGKLKRNSL